MITLIVWFKKKFISCVCYILNLYKIHICVSFVDIFLSLVLNSLSYVVLEMEVVTMDQR